MSDEQLDLFADAPLPNKQRASLAQVKNAARRRDQAGKEKGIAQAIDHAGQAWQQQAYALFEAYAERHAIFMTEDVRYWAATQGLPAPPSERAWGAITKRALAAKLIAPWAWATGTTGHGQRKQVWCASRNSGKVLP